MQKTIVTYGWSNVIDIVENCTKSLLEGRRRISNRHKTEQEIEVINVA